MKDRKKKKIYIHTFVQANRLLLFYENKISNVRALALASKEQIVFILSESSVIDIFYFN